MNFIQYKVILDQQILDYKNFIPLTENNDGMLKLMKEIYKLYLAVEKIEEMNFQTLTTEVKFDNLQRWSKSNNLFFKI